MKARVKLLVFLFFLLVSPAVTRAQDFVAELNEEDFSALLGNPCTVTLHDGSKLVGKFQSGNLMNGYLTKTTFKLANGEKRKLGPEEVLRLSIKASTLVKLAAFSEASSSIKEYSKGGTRKKALLRDSVIFERALKPTDKDKFALMQLLNPGFNSKLKVFIDPQARRTTEFGLNTVTFTGGENRVYLLVKNDEKAFRIKKNSYDKNFDEIFSDCPMLVAEWPREKVEWKDVAAHVYFYEEICD